MYTISLLLAAIAALSTAAPVSPRDSVYHGVSLSLRITPDGTTPAEYEPAPVEINQLTSLGNTAVSEIRFAGSASNVDINAVECRAYRDAEGLEPGSAPFTYAQPAEISTNLDVEGSVLCYIVSLE